MTFHAVILTFDHMTLNVCSTSTSCDQTT